MLSVLIQNWRELSFSIIRSFVPIFLVAESYEVLTDDNIKISIWLYCFLLMSPGILFFIFDGYIFKGFLKREVIIPNPHNRTEILVKFGDIFKQDGWKSIASNDFFDSKVDEDLVSSKSLHGYVLNKYWLQNANDWDKQVSASLRNNNIEFQKETRSKGKRLRYPIGTTVRACTDNQKFLFVALGRTDTQNNVTKANAEMLICAVRKMLIEARAVCSMEPLIIPLMGSGLSRVEIKDSVLVDLIITAIFEESQNGLITKEIKIVVSEDKAHEINLKNHIRNWTDGK